MDFRVVIAPVILFVFFVLPVILAIIAGIQYWYFGDLSLTQTIVLTLFFWAILFGLPLAGIIIVHVILKDELCEPKEVIAWSDGTVSKSA